MNKDYLPKDLAGRMVYSEERGMGFVICNDLTSGPLGWFEVPGHDGDLTYLSREIPTDAWYGWRFMTNNSTFTILPRTGEKVWVWNDGSAACKAIFTGYDTDVLCKILTHHGNYQHFAFIEPEKKVELIIDGQKVELLENSKDNILKVYDGHE